MQLGNVLSFSTCNEVTVLCCRTDRGLISIDGNIVHLVEVVVQEALLGVGLDDLAQGLPAQLFGGQSWRLAVKPLWRPEGGSEIQISDYC